MKIWHPWQSSAPKPITNRTNQVTVIYMKYGKRIIVLALVLTVIFNAASQADKSPYDWALVRLDYARNEKIQQLQRFTGRMHNLAQEVREDQKVLAFFEVNLKFAAAQNQEAMPGELRDRIKQLRDGFNRYYIENYFTFYDILFVDSQGNVFYSIRKEADFMANLHGSDFKESALAQCLDSAPKTECFVDFHNYGPSDEPAAFFVEPIFRDSEFVGWIVLQCAINKIDSLFAWTEDLGETGETFLVNQEGIMLTESNFTGASTILEKRLDDRNIQAKFTEGQGHRVVTDYRGRTALTSFEVVKYMGTSWLAVAKVDMDEITTDHYTQHRRFYADKLLENLQNSNISVVCESWSRTGKPTLLVDMDEFLKVSQGQCLETFGISTCTGLLIACPGKFAYLAHISPRDKVYNSDGTNLLGQMIKRIKSFDIYPSEKRQVVFTVVAPHLESTLNIIDKIVEEGYQLAQIQVFHNPQATSAAMIYDYQNDDLEVIWKNNNQNEQYLSSSAQAANAGEIVQSIMLQQEGVAVNKGFTENLSSFNMTLNLIEKTTERGL